MNKITYSILIGLLSTSAHALAHKAGELEPCIDGGVSASGLYVTQEAEDRYELRQVSATMEEDLEPCINGGVSASGLFVNQEAEDELRTYRIGQQQAER